MACTPDLLSGVPGSAFLSVCRVLQFRVWDGSWEQGGLWERSSENVGVPQPDAERYTEAVRGGRVLLVVRAADDKQQMLQVS